MSEKPSKPATPEKDLMDAIADALPAEVRAEYYRAMAHLRNLPENDELLIVLQAIRFLGLLMEQIPSQILAERREFQRLWGETAETIAKLLKAEGAYYKEIDRRLTELPASIAKGVSPTAIVELINGALKRQFEMSTIPTVAGELSENARTIQAATKEHGRAFERLCGSWSSVEARAKRAIDEIEAKAAGALAATKSAAESLDRLFNRNYFWIVVAYAVVSFSLGVTVWQTFFCPDKPTGQSMSEAAPEPAVQAQPSRTAPPPRRK